MNSKQHNLTSSCGDLALNADKGDLAEPQRTSGCCGTEATTVSSRSCGSNVGPTPSVARAERETAVAIARATAEDLGGVLSLLESLRLPTAGVADHFGDFFVARAKNGRVVGAIGLEHYGNLGLLRSAAVAPQLQKSGVGTKLTTLLIGFARGEGLTELVLFTPSARDFFARFGFVPANREDYDTQLKASAEWADCSCGSAEFMSLALRAQASCGCRGDSARLASEADNPNNLLRNVAFLAVGVLGAVIMYAKLPAFADWVTYSALSIPRAARIAVL